MPRLRIGVIGCGFIANLKHFPSLTTFPERCVITALCDLELDRADKAKADYHLEAAYTTADYHRVVDDPDIDVIHVCTPNNSHREITVAALEAGKHVLCEKPMAISGADARAMVDAAQRCGRKLTIGYQNRFRKDARFVRRAIDEGRLGDIYVGRAYAVRRRGVPTWGVFRDKEKQGGGPLIDLGGHALDLTLWYMDNYDVDYVVGATFDRMRDKPEGNLGGPWNPAEITVEDSAFGFVKMTDGSVVTIDASWALNVPESREGCTTLCGTEGGAQIVSVDGAYVATLNGVVGGELTETAPEAKAGYFGVSGSGDNPGALEVTTWFDAIEHDTDPVVLPQQACRVTEILEAVYRSAATNQAVRL